MNKPQNEIDKFLVTMNLFVSKILNGALFTRRKAQPQIHSLGSFKMKDFKAVLDI